MAMSGQKGYLSNEFDQVLANGSIFLGLKKFSTVEIERVAKNLIVRKHKQVHVIVYEVHLTWKKKTGETTRIKTLATACWSPRIHKPTIFFSFKKKNARKEYFQRKMTITSKITCRKYNQM